MTSVVSFTVVEYLAQLASGNPVPGGGAASSISGAQGAALLAMTLRVSGGKDQESLRMLDQLDDARQAFLNLAVEDGLAFDQVMAVLKMPRQSDEEKTVRKMSLEASLKKACKPPFATIVQAFLLLKQIIFVMDHAKPSVVSDAAIAAHLLKAAIDTARYNVWINLKGIADPVFKQYHEKEVIRLVEESEQLTKEATKKALEIMGIKESSSAREIPQP